MFLPLTKPARYKGAFGGRGSGKSHFYAELLIEDCVAEPGNSGTGMLAVCVREVQKDLSQSVKRLLEMKLAKHGLGEAAGFRIYRDVISVPGDGVIIFKGMQDYTAESIKSLEGFKRLWWEEAQTASKRSLEMTRPTIRAAGSEFWFSWNPRNATDPVDELLRGVSPPPRTTLVNANWSDNPFLPDELALERAHDLTHNPGRYGHIWEGEYEPSAIGAIWDREVLHRNRRDKAPELSRIVVAVDPAVSSEERANETGITVQGLGVDRRGYLLDDLSTHGSPRQWAERTVAAFDRYEADAVVIEINQGGDMVKHTLRSIRPNLPVIEVRATRGKHVRAEPISSLYALDKISHVGTYPELENQMCLMTAGGFEGDGSPDRCDALVWGWTHLFPQIAAAPRKEAPVRSHDGAGASGWMG